jgi:hypothetical protein
MRRAFTRVCLVRAVLLHNPEHLSERRPEEIVTIFTAIPDEVATAISDVEDAAMRRKPAPDKWCVN